jgi:hypothetical protein
MSDNQSNNSQDWGNPANGQRLAHSADPVALAKGVVKLAEQAVDLAEHQLQDAKTALKIAQGRLHIAIDRPTWKKILCPGIIMDESGLYTLCIQSGYSYALWNGRIFRAGNRSEQMVDTGATEADIK